VEVVSGTGIDFGELAEDDKTDPITTMMRWCRKINVLAGT
jgi:hypothetical protein